MSESEIVVTSEEYGSHHKLLVEGEDVSRLSVIDLQMRIGSTVVHMGGIGGVGTNYQQRNKGYSRRVLEHANEWMAANGYDCATLFGIPDFYHRYGYASCLPDSRIEILTRSAEKAIPSLTPRLTTPEDLPTLRALYAANNAEVSGSIVRGDKTRWFRKGSRYEVRSEGIVFTDRSGAIKAYLASDVTKDQVVLSEVASESSAYYADIVRWAAERGIERRVEKLRFVLPPEHPFLTYLALYGAEHKVFYTENGNCMGRLLNLTTFFEKTLPEWTKQAQKAGEIATGQSVKLETDIGSLTLRWTGDAVQCDTGAEASGIVRLPQYRLFQLAIGYIGAELLSAFSEVTTEGDVSLLHVLFPRRLAHMWSSDHF